MTQPIPAAIPSDGNLKVAFVLTLADPANPTVAELTAASVVDLSCYLTSDGYTPSTDEQVTTDDRLCSRQTFEDVGRFTDHLQVKYVYQGQNPSAVDNKAQTTLVFKAAGYVVERWGKAYEDAFAAADIVNTMPVRCGVQQYQPGAPNEKLKILQNLRITGPQNRAVAVVS